MYLSRFGEFNINEECPFCGSNDEDKNIVSDCVVSLEHLDKIKYDCPTCLL